MSSPHHWVNAWQNSKTMLSRFELKAYEPRHDKTNKMSVRPVKTPISMGIRLVWSESSLSAWRNLGSLATHWVHSEDSDQTGRRPRLIWLFAGHTLVLLVLSCCSSVMGNSETVNHYYSCNAGLWASLGEEKWSITIINCWTKCFIDFLVYTPGIYAVRGVYSFHLSGRMFVH